VAVGRVVRIVPAGASMVTAGVDCGSSGKRPCWCRGCSVAWSAVYAAADLR
jgi:hypothetical protein